MYSACSVVSRVSTAPKPEIICEDVKKAFSGISDDVKEAVDLKLEPEKKTNDQPQVDPADDEKNETQTETSESGDFDNLKNLKHAFDNIEPNSSATDDKGNFLKVSS